MYIVKYGNKYLHNRALNVSLAEVSLDMEDNSIGYCDFTIYPGHELYNDVKERDLDNPVVVYENDTILFSGYVYQISESFDTTKQIRCKGDLDFLNESVVRPYSTRTNTIGDKAPDTVNGYFEWLIQQHNNQVPANKRFVVGINQGADLDPNNYIYRESRQYPGTLSEINEKIIEELGGGYIRVRWENGIRYIDLISKWTEKNTQIIQFGVNLTDYRSDLDTEDVFTYVVPLGAQLSETDYDYDDGYRLSTDEELVEGKTYYTQNYESIDKVTGFDPGVKYYEMTEIVMLTEDTTPYSGITYAVYRITGYVVTEDTTMDASKTYYTLSPYEATNLTAFVEGTDYYEAVEHIFKTEDQNPVEGIDYYVQVASGDQITYQKKTVTTFEAGTTYYEKENEYVKTSDTVPQANKKYYTYDYDNFSMVYKVGRFLKYEKYYEAYDQIYKTSTVLDNIIAPQTDLETVDITSFEDDVVYYELEDAYYQTEDTEPDNEKTYYVIPKHSFNEVYDLGRFKHYADYYEYFEDLDQSTLNINIKEYDDGPIGDGYYKKGDMIYNIEAVKRYGYIGMIYKNEDIHETVYLKNKGIAELEKALSPLKSIEVNAVDIHFINPAIQPIKIGEYVRIKSVPHGLDMYFLCRSVSLDLNNPGNSTYSFGAEVKSLTGKVVEESETINATASNVSSLSSNVEHITQIVNKTEQTVINYKYEVNKLSDDLTSLKDLLNSVSRSLNNEINVRSNNDKMHDNRLDTLEDEMPYYIMRTLKFSNPLSLKIQNETKSIDSISFAVMFPVTVKVNVDCIFDVETDVSYGDTYDVYDEVQVEVQYIVNGILSDWKPVETYLDGKHLLSTTYDIYVGTTETQNLEVLLRVSGGTIKIAQEKAKVILSAQSLRYIFTGDINIYDEVPVHRNMVRIGDISDGIEIETKQYQNPDGDDVVNPVRLNKYFKIITDGTEVSTNA